MAELVGCQVIIGYYGRTSRVLPVRKSGCGRSRVSRPGRGNSKESFSSYQETGNVFSPEMPFYSKFGNM